MDTRRYGARSLLMVSALTLVACGRETAPADVKMAGVGLNPEEIASAPTPHGGFVEYDWLDFAGANLPLASLGLTAFDPAGPGLSLFNPPYAMVYGLGFLFGEDMDSPDALLGTFAAPPEIEGTCQTVYEPTSYLSSIVDAGGAIDFASVSDDSSFQMGRYPEIYPPDPQDVFSYYFGLETWRVKAQTRWALGAEAGDDPAQMVTEVVQESNFVHGGEVEMSFPGGIPPLEANVGSIPVPLSAAQESVSLTLPTRTAGLMLEWDGPTYDEWGAETDN
ncbi:MAG: hypothetical protein QGG40_16145, partial [Myxococcota bacterium]|nr:hypothetical protein [Myxococcota bacterium]